MLRLWNKIVFGNIFERIERAERLAQETILLYEQVPSQERRMEMNKAAAEYLLIIKMEEDYWRQKATVKWVAEGERNSKFFQGWVKQKRTKSKIHAIEDGDQTLTEDAEIRSSAANYFQNL